MICACVQVGKTGRLASFVGALILGALIVLTATPGAAQNPGKNPPAKPDPAKDKEKDKGKEKQPEPLKLTIVTDEKSAEVPEMAEFINKKLEEGWKANKITPSRYADDYEFIRRASLDIIGRIAKPEEIRQFEKDPKDKRRSLLIERLLASEEYPRHWANVWTNWLLTRSGPFGRGDYHEDLDLWLEYEFSLNQKYNDIVRKLITAKGENSKNGKNGAVNFVLAHTGEEVPAADREKEGRFQMVPLTSRITRLFLGMQVQCAQCHDHPFRNDLKQNHFWGVNAFLRQVDREGRVDMRRQDGQMVLTLKDNTAFNPEAKVFAEKRNGRVLLIEAEFLTYGEKNEKRLRLPADMGEKTRREYLAEYLIAHENFPRAIVNRMWSVFFGRGFTNPVDDFHDQNTPSNPELLNELSYRFKHYNYDLKRLIRWMCNSNAYNLSHVTNATNDKPENEQLFSRMVVKSMSPEQLFESLMVATQAEAAETKDGKKALRKKWLDSLITNFGDDEGNEVNFNGTVVQALMMMNGPDINAAIAGDKKGTVIDAMKKHNTPPSVINELFLASLNRPPTAREIQEIMQNIELVLNKKKDTPAARYQDLFWALLNSNEFLLNH
jgi:hypothetical protein